MSRMLDVSARVSGGPASSGPRSRNWCFTLADPEGHIPALFESSGHLVYILYQGEVAASGLYHFQGYLQFSVPLARSTVKNYLHEKAHVEPRLGSHDQAVGYCTKEDTRVDGPWSRGSPVSDKNQGKRNDLADFYDKVKSGQSDLELADHNFALFSRTFRAVDRIRLACTQPRSFKTSVVLLYGPSGTGKTSWVHKHARGEIFHKPKDGWWNGYTGQPNVLLDDMADWLPYQMLLDISDRYPVNVPQKLGPPVVFNSRTIYITCVRGPRQWGYSVYSLIEFYRRVDIVYVFDQSFDVVKTSIGELEGDPSIDASIAQAQTTPPWAQSAGSQDSPIEIE